MGRTQRNGMKAAILAMSVLQMATNAIAAILADIMAEFPGVSAAAVQYLMTFPNLLVVVTSLAAARLAVVFPKRVLASVGLVFGVIAGIGSFFFHSSLVLLFLWAGFLGCGSGLTIPVATSLISDYFDGEEKDTMLGYQTAAANVGSMLMTFFGGILAAFCWYYNYLVYLLAIPGLVLTILFVPARNMVTSAESRTGKKRNVKAGIPASALFYFLTAAVFMLLFYMGPTNLAMLVEERGIGGSMTAGMAATLLLLGGTAAGLLFGKIARVIGKNTIVAGMAVLAAGYLMIYGSGNQIAFYLGSFLVGTSNTMVLPQCLGSVVTEDKEQSTALMSAVFAVANLGTFFAPALTGLSAAVMGVSSASSRFLFTGLLAALLAAAAGFYLNTGRRKG